MEYYDAMVPGRAWANMCNNCFSETGARLGLGRGQHYVAIEGRWVKQKEQRKYLS